MLKVFLKMTFWTFLQFCGIVGWLVLSTASCWIFLLKFGVQQHQFHRDLKIIYVIMKHPNFKMKHPNFKMILKCWRLCQKWLFGPFSNFAAFFVGSCCQQHAHWRFGNGSWAFKLPFFGGVLQVGILKMKHPNFEF